MNSKPPDQFDEWWSEMHTTEMLELDSDVDECVQDYPFDDPPAR
jgi:hypothetical protein